MEEAGVRQCIWPKQIPTCNISAPVWPLENFADELFEDVFTGRNDIDLAEWLGLPIARQSADIEFVENFHMPAEGDFGMAGAPADSESTVPATDEEIQAM
eukprot:3326445-Pyramimonas_sp.AAC.1